MVQPNLNGASKSLLIFAALVIAFAGLKLASAIVVPLFLSIFIAIICNPLINFLSQYKVPKGISIVIVISLIVLVIVSLAGLVGQSVNGFSQNVPIYKAQLQTEFSGLLSVLEKYNILIDKERIMSLLDPSKLIDIAANTLAGVGGVMADLFLIILTVVFMLLEAPNIGKKIHLALDDPDMKQKQIDLFLDSVNSYLAIKTLVSLATGLLVTFMLWAFSIDYFILWGVLAFFLNYIPNIGSIIAAVPAVLLAIVLQGTGVAALIATGYMAINMVMGNMIEPRYLGKGLGLSSLVVFLSLLFWGWLLGSVGMLLSVPLTMVVKIALENSEEGKWLAILLGGEEQLNDEIES
jgi:predicted PurR-regulated permease PerM